MKGGRGGGGIHVESMFSIPADNEGQDWVELGWFYIDLMQIQPNLDPHCLLGCQIYIDSIPMLAGLFGITWHCTIIIKWKGALPACIDVKIYVDST